MLNDSLSRKYRILGRHLPNPTPVSKQKECPSCAMEIESNATECPICGYEFPKTSQWNRGLALVLLAIMLYWLVLRHFI